MRETVTNGGWNTWGMPALEWCGVWFLYLSLLDGLPWHLASSWAPIPSPCSLHDLLQQKSRLQKCASRQWDLLHPSAMLYNWRACPSDKGILRSIVEFSGAATFWQVCVYFEMGLSSRWTPFMQCRLLMTTLGEVIMIRYRGEEKWMETELVGTEAKFTFLCWPDQK